MTATSFTLKWLPSESDGGKKILEYIVELKEADKKTFKKIGASKGDLTELPISELKTNVAYNFKITARNEIGLSEPFIPDEKIVAGQRLSKSCDFSIPFFFRKKDLHLYFLNKLNFFV